MKGRGESEIKSPISFSGWLIADRKLLVKKKQLILVYRMLFDYLEGSTYLLGSLWGSLYNVYIND